MRSKFMVHLTSVALIVATIGLGLLVVSCTSAPKHTHNKVPAGTSLPILTPGRTPTALPKLTPAQVPTALPKLTPGRSPTALPNPTPGRSPTETPPG